MLDFYLQYIPDEIINIYILPYINNKIKILLCKEYYHNYHNTCYEFSYKYLNFIIKNNIIICQHLLENYSNFNITKKEKIYFENAIFFIVYDYCIYLSKKYNNNDYYNYFKNLYKKQLQLNKLNNSFSNLRIKGYKNFVNKNILWMK